MKTSVKKVETSRPNIKPGASKIQSKSASHSAALFSQGKKLMLHLDTS
jgi:hypothetical protein